LDRDNAPVRSGVTPPYPSAVPDLIDGAGCFMIRILEFVGRSHYYFRRLNSDVCAIDVVRVENIEAVYAWLLGQHREPSQFYFVAQMHLRWAVLQ
jgi:hypothetical protein